MKKIRILNVSFDTEIAKHEIPAFRGAIVDKVGRENVLFHNHISNNEFRYKYPLIQYKTSRGNPAIMCIDYGVDEIHKFFENKNWDINISGRKLEMKINQLKMNQFTMQVWDKRFDYQIRNWIALNTENYRKYQELTSLAEQLNMLESILKANILSFAKGIDWHVDRDIEVGITNLVSQRPVRLKKQKVIGFNLDFSTNVFLPNGIGLGKSVSLGFGKVWQAK